MMTVGEAGFTMGHVDGNLILQLTAEIVSAYVTKNSLPANLLPDLIASISAALERLAEAPSDEEPALQPAVSPKRSIQQDHLVCLEDGRKFKSLKRHLSTHHGMKPGEYRTKWGLPADYPMVAPDYAAARSVLARTLGLGRVAAQQAAAEALLNGWAGEKQEG